MVKVKEQKKDATNRSSRSYFGAKYSGWDSSNYRMREDERYIFRQVLMDSGMSRGQIQAMLG